MEPYWPNAISGQAFRSSEFCAAPVLSEFRTFGAKRAVKEGEDRTMKVIQLLNEYEAYRSYALRAKRLGRPLLAKSFQDKAIYALDTLELVLGCRLHCI
jgi:hypothetical protein